MKTLHRSIILVSCLFLVPLLPGTSSGWQEKTHLAIARAAGYVAWYNAAAADMTKLKAGETEGANHWFNNTAGLAVTEDMVMDQVKRYNKASDTEGHIYGAIIASLRNYIRDREEGKFAEYRMAFCVHYIGDLSMPLHNVPYDSFNEQHHNINDGIVEQNVLNNIGLIRKKIHPVVIHNERDLVREIARIANIAHRLALRIERENRDMTRDEAYAGLAQSASLLRAVLNYAKGETTRTGSSPR